MPNSYLAYFTANDALKTCMDAQNVEAFKAMNAADQAGVCATEASAVRSMLQSDQVDFRNLLAERLAAVKAQH